MTDKDIDRLSEKLFYEWGLLKPADEQESMTKEHKSLGSALASSRSACIMPYLVGAAPVLYGFPRIPFTLPATSNTPLSLK